MLRGVPNQELVLHSKARPIGLAGPPDHLTGYVYFDNRRDQHVAIRSAWLRGLPEPVPAEIEVPMGAIIRAGRQERVKIVVRLPHSTPPGEYEATLAFGEFLYPAHLQVLEDFDLEIVPSLLVLENHPGTRVIKPVIFRNRGNVLLRIGSPEAVLPHENLLLCRTVRGGLAAGVESDARTVGDWMTAFLRDADRNVREAGLLYIRNREGETLVPPGESRTVHFLIRQPDTQSSNRTYFAVAFFYTVELSISLVPAGAPAQSREAGEPDQEGNEPKDRAHNRRSERSRSRT